VIFTGFLRGDEVSSRDLVYWNYFDGVIEGANAFEVAGNNDTCWILIHSYAATPLEMKGLALAISEEFGDRVLAVRLAGHGEVPGNLYGLSMEDWYSQVSGDFERVVLECGDVNIVGSSFGGALSLRLAEDYDFKNLYVINGYIFPTYEWYYIFSPNFYLDIFSSVLHYSKKGDVAKINDPEGLGSHIAYRNFVFSPVKDSRDFLDGVYGNLSLIEEGFLIQYSSGDRVAEPGVALEVFERVGSESKEFVLFERSNHVILADYDAGDAIENVLAFERRNRQAKVLIF